MDAPQPRLTRKRKVPIRRQPDTEREGEQEAAADLRLLPRLNELDPSAQARALNTLQQTSGNETAALLVEGVQRQVEVGAAATTAAGQQKPLERRILALRARLRSAQAFGARAAITRWDDELGLLSFRLGLAETPDEIETIGRALDDLEARLLTNEQEAAAASATHTADLLVGVLRAQNAAREAGFASSPTRISWVSALNVLRFRLEDAETGTLEEALQANAAFRRQMDVIDDAVMASRDSWSQLEESYEAERADLSSEVGKAGLYALDELEKIHAIVQGGLDAGAYDFLVPEDYALLRHTLDNNGHLWAGERRAARERVEALIEMLDVVAQIRRAGEDENEIVPGWHDRLWEERDRLQFLAEAAPSPAARGDFQGMIGTLWRARDRALEAKPPEQGLGEKAYLLGKGALSAVAAPFIEAGKQLVDLGQIAAYYGAQHLSKKLPFLPRELAEWEPSFISDVGKAAEEGKGTLDILGQVVKGTIETPGRWLDAVRRGDYEAIGQETVNLYGVAKMAKSAGGLKGRVRTMIQWSRARRLARGEGGISPEAAYQALQQAKQRGLIYRVRPVEKAVVMRRQAGHPAKPQALKMKTIKDVDLHLGASPREIGLVGFFNPRLPANLGRLPARLRRQILDRYQMRKREWSRMQEDVARLERKGLVAREGNTIVDTRTGKAFTGDYDIFDITIEATGEAAPPEAWETLKGGPFEAQHGALEAWDIPPGKAATFADLVLEARPGGKVKLIEFHPDGTIRYRRYTE